MEVIFQNVVTSVIEATYDNCLEYVPNKGEFVRISGIV
jgi:hypothetical protein